jgi:hypothetical protein
MEEFGKRQLRQPVSWGGGAGRGKLSRVPKARGREVQMGSPFRGRGLRAWVLGTKSGYNRNTCSLMFIAALFTIVKLWKQLRSPDEWIKKI